MWSVVESLTRLNVLNRKGATFMVDSRAAPPALAPLPLPPPSLRLPESRPSAGGVVPCLAAWRAELRRPALSIADGARSVRTDGHWAATVAENGLWLFGRWTEQPGFVLCM